MWDDSKHNVLNMIEGTFSISLNIIEDDGFSWWFTSVYGPVNKKKRKLF